MRHGVLVRCNRQRNNETKHVTMGCVVPRVAGPGRRPTTEAAAMVRQKRMSPTPGAAPLARLPLPVHAPRKRIAKERGDKGLALIQSGKETSTVVMKDWSCK